MGIEGDELADSLTRGAAKKTASRYDKFTSHSFLKQKATEYDLNAWHNDWLTEVLGEEEGRKCRGLVKFYRIQAQMHIPTFSLQPFNFQNHSRIVELAFFQVRTGIGNIKAYLNINGKAKDKSCNFCKAKKQTTKY